MKVKISKTIDVNQLPDELRKMLDQTKNSLAYGLTESMNQVVMHSLSSKGEEFFQAIDLISSLRQELAALDESLQEIQNIFSGYKKAIMPEPEIAKDEPSPEWAKQQEAEYEKLMSQMDGADEEEEDDEVENEEG